MTTNLIIGGTGKTGRRVASRLQDRGLPVTSLSRPEFDWADPTTWSSVEQPAETAYVTYYPDLAFPGAPEAVAEVVERMARSGVRRVRAPVRPRRARGPAGGGEAGRGRGAATAPSGASSAARSSCRTSTRACSPRPSRPAHLAFCAGAVQEPFLDLEDVAEVAVGMLVGEIPANRVYELTGPELMTFADATAAIASATGRSITYTEITVPELVADLVRVGLPAEEAEELGGVFAHILDGHNEQLADGVQQALGRPARSFAEYAARAVAAGAWAGQADAS